MIRYSSVCDKDYLAARQRQVLADMHLKKLLLLL